MAAPRRGGVDGVRRRSYGPSRLAPQAAPFLTPQESGAAGCSLLEPQPPRTAGCCLFDPQLLAPQARRAPCRCEARRPGTGFPPVPAPTARRLLRPGQARGNSGAPVRPPRPPRTPAPPRPPACPARRRAARPLTLPRADGGGRPSTTPRRRFCPARFCRPPSRARSTGCSGWHGAELTLPAPGASRLADAALAMARLLCRAGRAGAQLSMGYDAMRCLRPIVRARAERARTLRRARRARRRWASRGGSAARPPCLGLGRAGDPCARLPPRPSSAACGFGLDLMLLLYRVNIE